MKTIRIKSPQSLFTVTGFLLITMLIQGCASTTLRPVKSENRDIAGNYDGLWHAKVKSTARTQPGPGNWVMTCTDLAGTGFGTLEVDAGRAILNGDVAEAFVSQTGKFRFEIPVAEVAAASHTSDSSISNGKMTFILRGSLESQSGSMTMGIAQFGNNGCSSKVTFTKQ